ncbi:hypothetical protein SY89_01786 [Halolamina pelagica]|uniref:Uncharacterized protein n=1 Tax=Halolamina pelagica TaxID=699431 RepID=A0A0P7HVU3_9EURY|nr:hypothetical protein [Halolamina pelagica]KPN31044.1 hypothetical protein SY89_01786 [Halolamina pelagica]
MSDVIETLSLATDPLDQSATAVGDAAVLDRLVGVVEDWEGDRTFSLSELAAALGHARRNPKSGPSLPTAAAADVTFRTIHGAKGDEDDVVAVADLGTGLGRYGAYLDQFVAHGRHVALAPPAVDTGDDYPDLGGPSWRAVRTTLTPRPVTGMPAFAGRASAGSRVIRPELPAHRRFAARSRPHAPSAGACCTSRSRGRGITSCSRFPAGARRRRHGIAGSTRSGRRSRSTPIVPTSTPSTPPVITTR